MSRIDELIAKLAPRGVLLRPLGEVGQFIRGNGLQKSDLSTEGFPAVHYGQIHTAYGIWTQATKSFTHPDNAAKLRRAKPGDLLIATTSEDDAAVAKATAWIGDGEVALSGDAYIFRHSLDPKFVSYFFQSERFQEQKKRFITGTKVRRVTGDALARIRIPVPPLQVQREIARVLDRFTGRLGELEVGLSAEASRRTDQYAYYRQRLLDEVDDLPPVPVSDVAYFFNARAHEKLVDPEGSVALLTARFISTNGRMARYVRPADVQTPALKGDVALVMSDLPNGRALARTFYVDADDKYAANQRVCLLRARDNARLLPRFLFHVMNRNPQLLAYNNGMDQTHLKKGAIQDVQIGLPPIEEQRRNTALLDRLDASVGELVSSAIPAEIALRRTQYEYYRDKLMTFEELPA